MTRTKPPRTVALRDLKDVLTEYSKVKKKPKKWPLKRELRKVRLSTRRAIGFYNMKSEIKIKKLHQAKPFTDIKLLEIDKVWLKMIKPRVETLIKMQARMGKPFFYIEMPSFDFRILLRWWKQQVKNEYPYSLQRDKSLKAKGFLNFHLRTATIVLNENAPSIDAQEGEIWIVKQKLKQVR